MKLKGKTAVVTGGASGIGAALAERFAEEGAKVAVADLDEEAARKIAAPLHGLAVACDVTKEAGIQDLVDRTEGDLGPIDLFCSNAGICFSEPDLATSASNAQWQSCWEVHVMAHVYAARAVLPGMIERGGGYLLQMVSAAGLLNQIGDAAYSASKHAALGFAEALAITHGDQGIKVSAVCPQYVATPMIGYDKGDDTGAHPGVISPDEVAACVIRGLEEERFLILPHPQVAAYSQHKAADPDRWIKGMRRLRRRVIDEIGTTDIERLHKLI